MTDMCARGMSIDRRPIRTLLQAKEEIAEARLSNYFVLHTTICAEDDGEVKITRIAGSAIIEVSSSRK
jgi:hypothetical protein